MEGIALLQARVGQGFAFGSPVRVRPGFDDYFGETYQWNGAQG